MIAHEQHVIGLEQAYVLAGRAHHARHWNASTALEVATHKNVMQACTRRGQKAGCPVSLPMPQGLQ